MPPWLPYLLSPLTALIVWYIQTQSARGVSQLNEINKARDDWQKKADERLSVLEREHVALKGQSDTTLREQDRLRDTVHKVSETVQTHSAEIRLMGRK